MMIEISAHAMTLAYIVRKRLGEATKGATAVEYGLLIALITAVIIAAVTLFGGNLSNLFKKVATTIVK